MYGKESIKKIALIVNRSIVIQAGNVTDLAVDLCGAENVDDVERIIWEASENWISTPSETQMKGIINQIKVRSETLVSEDEFCPFCEQ